MERSDVKLLCTKILLYFIAFSVTFTLIEFYVPIKKLIAGTEQDWSTILREADWERRAALIFIFSLLLGYRSYKKEKKQLPRAKEEY